MNDVEALQQILEDQNRSSFYWAIIILLAVNFLGVLANIFLSIYLKNKEAKHYRLQVREDRRLEIYEKLYYLLEELTYFDGRQNNNDLELKISNINSYTSQNNLYISKEVRTVVTESLDYYRSILTDYRKKNYITETNFLSEFAKEFNK